jgi:hypothetical protein
VGLVLGLANWALWTAWTKRLLQKKKLAWGSFFAISFVKLGLLAGIIWVLLAKAKVDPIGFLTGFSVVVLITLWKGFKWN